MFGIRFIKTPPTTYLLHFRNGRVVREGAGLSFFYYAPTSTLTAVPVGSRHLPFAFTETTADFQTVTLQGQLTWRVSDPKRLAGLFDFSLAPNGRYATDDPDKLAERLVNVTQILTRGVTQRLPLREALVSSEAIVAEVAAGLRKADSVTMLGVEILGFSLAAVRPTPEMAKALEAEAREALQRKADLALYDRRNAAVEQERRIKESELNTEIAVEEKKRAIRETQMAAEIAVEERRTELIDRRVANERKDADARGYALEATLKPVRDMDWKTLLAVAPAGIDPKLMIALAFREMAENAAKIGELNVTPDLLRGLLEPAGRGK